MKPRVLPILAVVAVLWSCITDPYRPAPAIAVNDPASLLITDYDSFEKTGTVRMYVYDNVRRMMDIMRTADKFVPALLPSNGYSIQFVTVTDSKGSRYLCRIELRSLTGYFTPLSAKVLIGEDVQDFPIAQVSEKHTVSSDGDHYYEEYFAEFTPGNLMRLSEGSIFQLKLYLKNGESLRIEFNENEMNYVHYYLRYLIDKGLLPAK